eukprot:14004108-Alexandrium_andersonii.AAC.1
MAPKRRSSILRWGLPAGPPPGGLLAAARLGAVGTAPAAPAGQAKRIPDGLRPPVDAPGQTKRTPDGLRSPGMD